LLHAEALAVFPIGRREREAAAVSGAMIRGIPPGILLPKIDLALREDPGSANILFTKAIQEVRLGNFEKAQSALLTLELVAPGWVSTKELKDFIAKAKIEWEVPTSNQR